MQTIPTPTTRTRTYESGETAQFTDWTIGAYALRKTEEPGYTGWAVLTADRDLPRVENENPGPTPKFGVSCYSNSGMNPSVPLSHPKTGSSTGASHSAPHRPYTTLGMAASRSIT